MIESTPGNMHNYNNKELSSPEETRVQFSGRTAPIKLGIDLHQEFLSVVLQVGGTNPKLKELRELNRFCNAGAPGI
ncbi:MAG: hypothetical protein M3128_09515 [Verrucomicrobiota bacterium]|nr:hypothetical protein [Verrucomicrobiota bacterium]